MDQGSPFTDKETAQRLSDWPHTSQVASEPACPLCRSPSPGPELAGRRRRGARRGLGHASWPHVPPFPPGAICFEMLCLPRRQSTGPANPPYCRDLGLAYQPHGARASRIGKHATISHSFPCFLFWRGSRKRAPATLNRGGRMRLGSYQAATPITRDIHGQSLQFPKLLRRTASSLLYNKDCVVTRAVPGT